LEQLHSRKGTWGAGIHNSVKLTGKVTIPEVAEVGAETTVTASLMGGGSESKDEGKKAVNSGHTASMTSTSEESIYTAKLDKNAKPK